MKLSRSRFLLYLSVLSSVTALAIFCQAGHSVSLSSDMLFIYHVLLGISAVLLSIGFLVGGFICETNERLRRLEQQDQRKTPSP